MDFNLYQYNDAYVILMESALFITLVVSHAKLFLKHLDNTLTVHDCILKVILYVVVVNVSLSAISSRALDYQFRCNWLKEIGETFLLLVLSKFKINMN